MSSAPKDTGQPPKASSGPKAKRLAPLQPRDLVELHVRYRGGSEAWWELRARGRYWRFPGSMALHDCLSIIYDGRGGRTGPVRG